jgi:hypothetical protein
VDGGFPANALRISEACTLMEIASSDCWQGQKAFKPEFREERMAAEQTHARKTGQQTFQPPGRKKRPSKMERFQ